MTILSTTLKWEGETSSDDESGKRTYEALYQIISDTATESPIVVKSVLPAMGTGYTGDVQAVVVDRNVSRISESREVWEGTVTYEFDPEEPDEPEDDPTAEPAEIDWSSSLELEPMLKDRNGDAIVNSAGDYFDPPPEFDLARWSANVQKNVSSVPADILSWAGAILNQSYTIDGITVESNKSRIIALSISKRQEKNDIPFRTVTMGIKFYREEVKVTALDQGFRFKDSDDVLKDILVADGDGGEQRPSSPVLLDGLGGVLADPTPETAVFLEFDPPVEELDPALIAPLLT